MTKFSIGQKVRITSGGHAGKEGVISQTLDGGFPYPYYVDAPEVSDYFTAKELRLIEDNNMKYKQGNVLGNGTYKRKVLGVCGDVYLMSRYDGLDYFEDGYTQKELDKEGYHLKSETPETIEILGKKYDKSAVLEQLKELGEVE